MVTDWNKPVRVKNHGTPVAVLAIYDQFVWLKVADRLPDTWNVHSDQFENIPEPPALKPWTLQTRPRGLIEVRFTGSLSTTYLVTSVHINGMVLGSSINATFKRLADDCEWRNAADPDGQWQPCGTKASVV